MTSGALDSAITETFDAVFYEGIGGFSTEVPYPWPISIAGRPFVVDLAHYQWSLPDMVRQAVDFSASPGEQSFDTGGVWLRSSGDWSLGSGQEYHDANDAEPRMFFRSLGIDPWTKRQITLLPATERAVTFTHQTLRLLPHGVYLYVMDGEGRSLGRTTQPRLATVTMSNITGGPASNFRSLTTDGELIYLATDTGIYVHDPLGSTMAAMGGAAGTTIADVLEFTNGWLLVGEGNELSSIDAAGALTNVMTHRVDGFAWNAIVGCPSGIYAGGQGPDDIAEIVHTQVDDTGALATPVHAASLPRGEQLRSLAYYGSGVLIGTSKGLRFAQINGDQNATLDVGPLIDTGADVTACFGESKFVWFVWSSYDATHTGVGRANLAEFRARQQPAYATDLMARTTGTVTDVCRFQEHTYFTLANSGLWREEYQGELVEDGTIELGNIEWGSFEPKAFIGLQLTTLPLVGSVSATVTDDAGAIESLGSLSAQGTTGRGILLTAGQTEASTFFALALTLHRSTEDATEGPTVRLVTARALILPRQVQRWILPIICTEKVRIGPDSTVEESQDVAAVRSFFVALRRSGEAVAFQEGDTQHIVVVRDVSFPDGQVQRWGTGRRGLQGLLVVTVDSQE